MSQKQSAKQSSQLPKRPKGRPSNYRDFFNDVAIEYLDECIATNEIPLESELIYKLMTDERTKDEDIKVYREILPDWAAKHPDFLHTLRRIKGVNLTKLQRGSLNGKYNPMIAKFLMSANHGMAETTKQEITGKDGQPQQVLIYLPQRGALNANKQGQLNDNQGSSSLPTVTPIDGREEDGG